MNGFDREDLHAPNAEINTTPLVDVMLVLMVIFLVTAPVLEKATNVELPKEQGVSINSQTHNVSVAITKEGKYFIEGVEIAESEISSRFALLKTKDSSVSIKADSKATHENVMKVVGAASRAGFAAVNFISIEN